MNLAELMSEEVGTDLVFLLMQFFNELASLLRVLLNLITVYITSIPCRFDSCTHSIVYFLY